MADPTTTTESQNKLNAGLRYAGTSAATLFAIFGAMQFVTPEQVAQLTAAVHEFNESILSAYGALTKMWVILGPVAILWIGKAGVQSSSIKALAGKLLSIAGNSLDPKASEAQAAIINGTNLIALNPAIETSKEAKVALLDGAAGLDEVVGTIKVTDPDLVKATNSEQVKAA